MSGGCAAQRGSTTTVVVTAAGGANARGAGYSAGSGPRRIALVRDRRAF